MGLLSDPKTRAKLVNGVTRFCNPLCILCFIIGVGWYFALPHRNLNAGTYFSENALLPGLVESGFKHEYGASEYLNDLKDAVKAIPKESDSYHRLPADWLVQQFEAISLDTYVHNFTFQYPAAILDNKRYPGHNVYGILRAPRAASTEAVVFTVPYRSLDTDLDHTHVGIAMMLALAKSFKRHTYWAKDIIFLVTEYEGIGMHAWLSAYYHMPSEYIVPGEMHGRAGLIQAAINLEMATENFHRVDVKIEGLDGQLPNLDLVNTVAQLCRREGVPITFQGRMNPGPSLSTKAYHHSMVTMMKMMRHQASGVPTGNHGYFHRYQIPAVTLHTTRLKSSSKTLYNFYELGRVTEGILRSLNNLLERFHQSFFFYLLPATDRYVSIGLYMPPFGVMAAPIIIKALSLWIKYSVSLSDQSDQSKANSADRKTTPRTAVHHLLAVVPQCIMAGFFSLAAYAGPTHFISTAQPFRMQPGDALTWGMMALLLSSCLFPYLLKRKSATRKGAIDADPSLMKCLLLLLLALALSATALLNHSLAVAVTIVWCPVAVAVTATDNKFSRFAQRALLLLVNPLSLLYIACLVHTYSPASSFAMLHVSAWQAMQRALLTSVLNSYLYASWTYTLVACGFYPVWVMMWALLWLNNPPATTTANAQQGEDSKATADDTEEKSKGETTADADGDDEAADDADSEEESEEGEESGDEKTEQEKKTQ